MEANDDEPFQPFAAAALSDLQARAAELVAPLPFPDDTPSPRPASG